MMEFSYCTLIILISILCLSLSFSDHALATKIKKEKETKILVLVDEAKHLQRSACNSETWFNYVENMRQLEDEPNLPQGLIDNYSEWKGIWFLRSKSFAPTTFDNPSPCMEFQSYAMLYEGLHFHYFLHSKSGSYFTIYDNSGAQVLANVTEPSQVDQDGKWDHVSIHEPGTLYHGFKLIPHIFNDDFLMIDTVAARIMSHKAKGQRSSRNEHSSQSKAE